MSNVLDEKQQQQQQTATNDIDDNNKTNQVVGDVKVEDINDHDHDDNQLNKVEIFVSTICLSLILV